MSCDSLRIRDEEIFLIFRNIENSYKQKIIDWFPHLHITRKKAFFLHFPMFQENDIKKVKTPWNVETE